MARIWVVGAGVSGLTTALVLQRDGHEVTVVTADDPLATVSAVAGAAWYPVRDSNDERISTWLRPSYATFMSLRSDPAWGIAARSSLELLRRERDDEAWRAILPGFEHVEPPAGYVDAWRGSPIPVIEMPTYLRALVRAVRVRSRIVYRRLTTLDEVPGDLVINCSGLGSRDLVGDDAMSPIRGQVVRVEQVGLTQMVLDEDHPGGITYIIPRVHDVVCGGVRDAGNDDDRVDPVTAREILARCVGLEPRLDGARIASQAAGLRPGRPRVRLERDGRVIHNYGHAGAGVSLSWGCAQDVARLVD